MIFFFSFFRRADKQKGLEKHSSASTLVAQMPVRRGSGAPSTDVPGAWKHLIGPDFPSIETRQLNRGRGGKFKPPQAESAVFAFEEGGRKNEEDSRSTQRAFIEPQRSTH